jgi:hypothetical protein
MQSIIYQVFLYLHDWKLFLDYQLKDGMYDTNAKSFGKFHSWP